MVVSIVKRHSLISRRELWMSFVSAHVLLSLVPCACLLLLLSYGVIYCETSSAHLSACPVDVVCVCFCLLLPDTYMPATGPPSPLSPGSHVAGGTRQRRLNNEDDEYGDEDKDEDFAHPNLRKDIRGKHSCHLRQPWRDMERPMMSPGDKSSKTRRSPCPKYSL